jgi:hypothetical protein
MVAGNTNPVFLHQTEARMRLINGISLTLGLAVFSLAILLGILSLNNPASLYTLLGLAGTLLVPTGFEFCR